MSDGEKMNTGDVARRMGLPQLTVAFLQSLGFKPIGKDKRADLWDGDEFPAMCAKVAEFVRGRIHAPMPPKEPAKARKKTEPKKPPAGTPDFEDSDL